MAGNPINWLGPKKLEQFTEEVTDAIVKANIKLQKECPGLIAKCNFNINGNVNAEIDKGLESKVNSALGVAVSKLTAAEFDLGRIVNTVKSSNGSVQISFVFYIDGTPNTLAPAASAPA